MTSWAGLELRQHAVNGRKADILALVDQGAVDILGRQVATVIAGEDLEDLHARQRDLESGFAKVARFHRGAPRASRGDSAMMRGIILQDSR